MPHVVAIADGAGHLSVEVDGVAFTRAPIGRKAFGALMDEIIRRHGSPLRVEVREDDGTTYTDILTSPATVSPTTSGELAAPAKAVAAGLIEVSGDGFIPGEDVAIATVSRHTSAGGSGYARSLVEVSALGPSSEVILIGRISGTTKIITAEGRS